MGSPSVRSGDPPRCGLLPGVITTTTYTGTSMALAMPDTASTVFVLTVSSPSVTTITARRGEGRVSSRAAVSPIAS